MRKTIVSIVVLFFPLFSVFSQSLINDAILKYAVRFETGNSKAVYNSSWIVYLKGDQSRTDLISNSGTETVIYDSKNGKGVLLREYSNQKLMVNLNQEEWSQLNSDLSQLKFSLSKEKTMINGYSCNSAESEGTRRITVYYTEDYLLNNVNYKLSFPALKGLPVRIVISGIDATYNKSATYDLEKLETDLIPVNTFDYPRSGYRLLNYNEMKRGN